MVNILLQVEEEKKRKRKKSSSSCNWNGLLLVLVLVVLVLLQVTVTVFSLTQLDYSFLFSICMYKSSLVTTEVKRRSRSRKEGWIHNRFSDVVSKCERVTRRGLMDFFTPIVYLADPMTRKKKEKSRQPYLPCGWMDGEEENTFLSWQVIYSYTRLLFDDSFFFSMSPLDYSGQQGFLSLSLFSLWARCILSQVKYILLLLLYTCNWLASSSTDPMYTCSHSRFAL